MTSEELIDNLRGKDYYQLYAQWRYASLNNWYINGEPGKWLSDRLDAFRRNLTADERTKIEAAVERRAITRPHRES